MIPALEQAYVQCEVECLRAGIEFRAEVANTDFIEASLPLIRGDLFSAPQAPFNAAILNPPYRKSKATRQHACPMGFRTECSK